MKVGFVSHTALVSGAEHSLLSLLRALPPEVDATLICPPGALARAAEQAGIRTAAICGTDASLKLHPAHTPRALVQMARAAVGVRRTARREGLEVLHANSVRAGVITRLATIGVRSRRRARVLHVRDALPPGPVADAVSAFAAGGADEVVAISRYVAERFRGGAGTAAPQVVDNPIDLTAFSAGAHDRGDERGRLALGADAFVVGVVGQITPWKGQAEAIEAVVRARAAVPSIVLVVAGEPTFVGAAVRFDNRAYLAELHDRVRALGAADVVHFVGATDDVPALLRALDLLLMPSWEEPLGRSALEAMAMGVPVVATSAGGPPEFIDDGVTGLLCAPRDVPGWAQAITELAEDQDRRAAIALAGHAAVTSRFGAGPHAERMTAIFRSAAQRYRVRHGA